MCRPPEKVVTGEHGRRDEWTVRLPTCILLFRPPKQGTMKAMNRRKQQRIPAAPSRRSPLGFLPSSRVNDIAEIQRDTLEHRAEEDCPFVQASSFR